MQGDIQQLSTWTEFCHCLTPPAPPASTIFYTLSVEKDRLCPRSYWMAPKQEWALNQLNNLPKKSTSISSYFTSSETILISLQSSNFLCFLLFFDWCTHLCNFFTTATKMSQNFSNWSHYIILWSQELHWFFVPNLFNHR